MIDIPSFLMRWFFLSNLIRDVAEIQMLPYTPYSPHQPNLQQQHHQHNQHPTVDQRLPQQHQQKQHYNSQQAPIQQQQQQPPAPVPVPVPIPCGNPEEEWRDHCLRGILSYPPGTQRLLVMDAMRVELVQQLGQYFRYVDSAWQRIREFTFGRSSKAHNKNSNKIEATSTRDSNSDMEVVDKFE